MPAFKPSFPVLRRSHPLAQGLVGAWVCYEGSGSTINDLSGQGNNGAFNGTVTWVGGQSGWALSFGGTVNAVDVASAVALNITGSITLSAWIKPTVVNGFQALVTKGTSTSWNSNNYVLGLNSTTAQFRYGATYSGGAVAAGVWTHLTATADGSHVSVYVNGVPTTSSQTTTPTANSQVLRFANDSLGGDPYGGQLGNVNLWNRVLSSSEVSQVYMDSFRIFRPARTVLKASAAAERLFLPANLSGLGAGGPFFANPLGG